MIKHNLCITPELTLDDLDETPLATTLLSDSQYSDDNYSSFSFGSSYANNDVEKDVFDDFSYYEPSLESDDESVEIDELSDNLSQEEDQENSSTETFSDSENSSMAGQWRTILTPPDHDFINAAFFKKSCSSRTTSPMTEALKQDIHRYSSGYSNFGLMQVSRISTPLPIEKTIDFLSQEGSPIAQSLDLTFSDVFLSENKLSSFLMKK